MKRLLLITSVVFGLILTASVSAYSQSDNNAKSHNVTIVIPEVQLLDIENTSGGNDITLTYTAPTEAGDPIAFTATSSTLWLNYTSIVTGVATRRITVQVDAPFPGADLKVAAAAPTGHGTLGTASGSALILTASPQDLVTGIGSCYTENGASKGIQLTYSVALNNTNFGDLRFGSDVTAVTYTLTDN